MKSKDQVRKDALWDAAIEAWPCARELAQLATSSDIARECGPEATREQFIAKITFDMAEAFVEEAGMRGAL